MGGKRIIQIGRVPRFANVEDEWPRDPANDKKNLKAYLPTTLHLLPEDFKNLIEMPEMSGQIEKEQGIRSRGEPELPYLAFMNTIKNRELRIVVAGKEHAPVRIEVLDVPNEKVKIFWKMARKTRAEEAADAAAAAAADAAAAAAAAANTDAADNDVGPPRDHPVVAEPLVDGQAAVETSAALDPSATEAAEASVGVGEAATEVAEASVGVGEAATEVAEASVGVGEAATAVAEAFVGVGEAATEVAEASVGVGEAATEVAEAFVGVGEAATEVAEPSVGVGEAATEVAEPSVATSVVVGESVALIQNPDNSVANDQAAIDIEKSKADLKREMDMFRYRSYWEAMELTGLDKICKNSKELLDRWRNWHSTTEEDRKRPRTDDDDDAAAGPSSKKNNDI